MIYLLPVSLIINFKYVFSPYEEDKRSNGCRLVTHSRRWDYELEQDSSRSERHLHNQGQSRVNITLISDFPLSANRFTRLTKFLWLEPFATFVYHSLCTVKIYIPH